MVVNADVLCELVINEIKNLELPSVLPFGENRIDSTYSHFNQSYEQAYKKAFTLAIPEKTRFRFVKRVIGKLIRTNISQQVDFNYQIVELVKAQQEIIASLHARIQTIESSRSQS